MRITKRQLKRIIKEEKARLLESNNYHSADRALGLYADTAAVDALENAFNDLLAGTNEDAYEDLGDEWEADMASTAAVTLAMARMCQAAGLQGQYFALMKTLK